MTPKPVHSRTIEAGSGTAAEATVRLVIEGKSAPKFEALVGIKMLRLVNPLPGLKNPANVSN
jgi:hypothetical protein